MLKDVMCKGLVSIFHKKTKIVVETIRENKKNNGNLFIDFFLYEFSCQIYNIVFEKILLDDYS